MMFFLMQVEPTSSVENLLMLAVGGLAAVITTLWIQIRADQKLKDKKLDECEQDRERLWAKIAGLETRLDENK